VKRGFTLLEMLVATLILGMAVAGLLAQLSTSMRAATRLVDYDRAAVLARSKMDELLLDPQFPAGATRTGTFDEAVTGGGPAGWRARLTPFEMAPDSQPGAGLLERIELEVWWGPEGARKSIAIEAFRRGVLPSGGPQ
jgi:general secretion pathway protein I